MKDFSNFLERAEQIAGVKFNTEQIQIARKEYDEMIDLLDAERGAIAFADRRKKNLPARLSFADTDEAEIDEIRQSIRNYYKTTRKVVGG